MIFKAKDMVTKDNRTHYPIEGKQNTLRHFVCRVTTKENPFGPHKHDGEEFWYILDGEGKLFLDGQEFPVEKGDLVVLLPWREHGLTSDTSVTWLCFG